MLTFISTVPLVKQTWEKDAASLEYYSDIADPYIPTIHLGVPNTERGLYLDIYFGMTTGQVPLWPFIHHNLRGTCSTHYIFHLFLITYYVQTSINLSNWITQSEFIQGMWKEPLQVRKKVKCICIVSSKNMAHIVSTCDPKPYKSTKSPKCLHLNGLMIPSCLCDLQNVSWCPLWKTVRCQILWSQRINFIHSLTTASLIDWALVATSLLTSVYSSQ